MSSGTSSSRTNLAEEEVQRGMGAVLSLLHESMDPTHPDHALSLLPAEAGSRPADPPSPV